VAALRRRARGRAACRVPRPAAPQRGRLRALGGGPAPDLRDAGTDRDRDGRLYARGRVREPLQRAGSLRLGLPADLRGGQAERPSLAGLRPERRGLALRHRAGPLRRPTGAMSWWLVGSW
jgi:hypothetical protein